MFITGNLNLNGPDVLQNSIRKTPRPIAMPPLDNPNSSNNTNMQQSLAGPAVGIRNLRNVPNNGNGNNNNSLNPRGNMQLNGLTPPGMYSWLHYVVLLIDFIGSTNLPGSLWDNKNALNYNAKGSYPEE